MRAILVVNAGSSSVKFQVFGTGDAADLQRLVKGQVDGIGTRPRLRAEGADGASLVDENYSPEAVPDPAAAIVLAGGWLARTQHFDLMAVGHRVVHGGFEFDRPVLVTREILDRLERYVPLAPLHQPNNLAPIRSLLANRPDLPQVACFDTAFHRGHDAVVDHYAIPERLYAEGVRRYGFHGLSYEFVAEPAPPHRARYRRRSRHRRTSRERRLHVRLVRRPERREHPRIHRARRLADGHPARADRSGGRALPA